MHRCGTRFGLVTVAQLEKIVCNVRRNLRTDQAVTAPAALPLVCDRAPTGVSRIATEQLLNFIKAQPDLSHGLLQTWFASQNALCSLTASAAIRAIFGRGNKTPKAPAGVRGGSRSRIMPPKGLGLGSELAACESPLPPAIDFARRAFRQTGRGKSPGRTGGLPMTN